MRTIAATILITLAATTCFAKAYFAGKEEMIKRAECIAVVTITSVEKTETKGRIWTYRQKVSARAEQCLKGDVEGTIDIYGMESFICAQCEFKKGRFILFLRKDGDLWAGSNWGVGIREIVGDNVEWFKDDKSLFDMQATPLKDVIEEIKAILDRLESESTQEKESAEDKTEGKD